MILAIDSSTQWISIALLENETILYEKTWKTSRRHTVELSPAITAAFQDCDRSVEHLQAVAVATGPGSFTSLRIGLAVAKGFSLSRHIPIIGVPSLDILAAAIPPHERQLICVLRAGRGRLAAKRYRVEDEQWKGTGEITVMTADELEESVDSPTIISGELDTEEKKVLARRWRNAVIMDPPLNVRRASTLAWIASKRLVSGDVDDSAAIAPIYLRTMKNVDR